MASSEDRDNNIRHGYVPDDLVEHDVGLWSDRVGKLERILLLEFGVL